jgi:xanthine dehydrogenase accessory factor
MQTNSGIKFWRFIQERISKSQPVILLCVLESFGSSPGRQGFKMAVAADGISGSIGGGIMEHKFVEMAKEKLKNIHDEPIVRKQLHNKVAKQYQSGMICSGEQTIVLIHLSKDDSPVIESIIGSLENNRNGCFKIDAGKISFKDNATDIPSYFFQMNSEEDWKYAELTGYKNHLYIIGGGHCSLAFSKIMSSMDFYIHLYEDRKELNTLEQNSFVHEKVFVDDYSALSELIPSGENNYVVIMTFGYRTDDIALRALIYKNFKYLGVLGSQAKMEKMFEEWRRDKLPEDKLKKIFASIGFSIKSQSPEEIGVSIAAEIIGVKNGK